MTLYFDKVVQDGKQYAVTDKIGQILGNLVLTDKGIWGFLTTERKLIFFTKNELIELSIKIANLEVPKQQQNSPKG